VRDDYYVRWIPAGEFIPDAAAANYATLGHATAWGGINFADAATGRASATIAVPQMWNSGTLSAVAYIANNTASAGNVNLTILGAPFTVAENCASSTTMYGPANFTMPAQNQFAALATTTTIAPNGGDTLIFFRVNRFGADAGDTFANVMCFLGLKVTYSPSRR
jgi:hypothetical protein